MQASVRRTGICIIAFVVLGLAVGGHLVSFAEDFEDPIDPDGQASSTFPLGGIEIDSAESGTTTVDQYESLEPQLTALLASGLIETEPSGTLVVEQQPTLDVWEE